MPLCQNATCPSEATHEILIDRDWYFACEAHATRPWIPATHRRALAATEVAQGVPPAEGDTPRLDPAA